MGENLYLVRGLELDGYVIVLYAFLPSCSGKISRDRSPNLLTALILHWAKGYCCYSILNLKASGHFLNIWAESEFVFA